MSKLEKWFLFFLIFTACLATARDGQTQNALFIVAFIYGFMFVVVPGNDE